LAPASLLLSDASEADDMRNGGIRSRYDAHDDHVDGERAAERAVGKRTLTASIARSASRPDVVQRSAADASAGSARTRSTAGAPTMPHEDGYVDALSFVESPGGGAPVPGPLRARFDASLGGGVGDVRLHDTAASHAAADALGARAFAIGHDVHFGAGQYDPVGPVGQALIAHEVVHTVQQRGVSSATQRSPVVSEPGDAAEVEAERLAPALVAGEPVAVTAAPAASVHRDAKRKDAPHAAPDSQDPSWISPSKAAATTPVQVGSVFFHTREYVLDDDDQLVLRQLARAYAPWAKRNLGTPGAPLGLHGNVIGYADPRTSVEPNNQQLSEKRAFWTAIRVAGALAAETGLDVGYFVISHAGAGIAPKEDAGDAGLEDPLPHQRRADIFLDGQAGDVEPSGAAPPVATDDPAVRPPSLAGWVNTWDLFAPELRAGNVEVIRGLSNLMLARLAENPTVEYLANTPPATLFTKHPIANIVPIKPPWWDGRTSQIAIGQGRGAGARKGLPYQALLLVRDYKELMFYQETEFSAAGGAYATLMTECRKDHADLAVIADAHQKLAYLLFMMNETSDLALKVALAVEEE
jgi:outer membrane protein OmpA-like peptidoglycan-associated protein